MPSSARRAWSVVGLLWIAFLINYLDRQVVFSMLPVLTRELGFSKAQLGLPGTVFTWVYCLAMPFAGRLADLVRRDRLVFGSIILWSLATLGTGLSGSVIAFLASRAAMGVTEALFMPAALGLIANFHPGATRSRALATFATGQFAGVALGGWFGGWAADHAGWRIGFYSLALLGFGYAALIWAAFRRHGEPPPEAAKSLQSRPLDIIKSKAWLALAAAFFMFCAMLWILLAWLALFIHERFGLTLTASGFAATVFLQAGSAAGTLAGGFLGDRAANVVPGGRLRVGAAGLLACTPFAWFVLVSPSLHAAEFCSGAFGLFGGMFIANLYAGAYDVVSERNYGIAAGALNLLGGFAGGAGVLLTGLLNSTLGVAFCIRIAAIASAVMSLLLFAVVARQYQSDCAAIRD
jgi:MFS family permease